MVMKGTIQSDESKIGLTQYQRTKQSYQ